MSNRGGHKTESKPRPEPLSRHGSSESITARVGVDTYHLHKSGANSRNDHTRGRQRTERPQSLNIPYIYQDDGVNAPRILFVAPPSRDRPASDVDVRMNDTKRGSGHSGRHASNSPRGLKEDLEDAIRLVLSKVKIQPPYSEGIATAGKRHSQVIDEPNRHQECHKHAHNEDDNSYPSRQDRDTCRGKTHQQQGRRDEAAPSSFPHTGPAIFYYDHRQPPESSSEGSVYESTMDYPMYADASAQTEAPKKNQHEARPDAVPQRTTSQRSSRVLHSRQRTPRVSSAEYYVVNGDPRLPASDPFWSRRSSGTHTSYQPPYHVLVKPSDEHDMPYNYDMHVRGRDDQGERRGRVVECDGELHRQHRKFRCHHARTNLDYEDGVKERRKDGGRGGDRRRESRSEGDSSGCLRFPFTKDLRTEYH